MRQPGHDDTDAAARKSRRGFTATLVCVFERWMPDPFVLAIALTVLVAIASALFAPRGALPTILTAWYAGIFGIFGFAFQMIMILVSGHALAHSPPVQRGLERLVSRVRTPNQGVALTFLVSAVASYLNWGFGLVIGAVLAREVARRVRLDFAWLVAAAYSGWIVWASGPSGTIPLAQASPGNALNIVEKITGATLPFTQTIFTRFTLVPTVLVVLVIPALFMLVGPSADEMEVFVPPPEAPVAPAQVDTPLPLARRAERSRCGNWVLVAAGIGYVITATRRGSLQVDANMVIFVFLILGLAFHRSPLHYIGAVREAAKHTGSMMLQYPIYGGIMGIMTTTGLAQVMSTSIVRMSSAHTLPFFAFLSSLGITFIIPSGGGHWAVQGPFTIPAAVSLGAPLGATTMAVAFGEQVANMIQPFWALPVVTMAGIGIQRVLGFTTLSFLVGVLLYGAALLIFI